MNTLSALLFAGLCGTTFVSGPTSAQTNTFIDPLDVGSVSTPGALQSPVYNLTRIDTRQLLGVGPRGLILLSTDNGKTWEQQPSPVSTDLIAAHFPDAKNGWVVGHQGVILHSPDGGRNWMRQLDGRQLGNLMLSFYEEKAATAPELADTLEDARLTALEGPTKPLLDVWFRNAQEGWAVGAFNLILHTNDGGQHWQPWLERTDNPQRYSLHAIHGNGNDVYVVGELGLLLRLDNASGKFQQLTSPYPGSWFGFALQNDRLVSFGLRGNAWLSHDQGRSWQALESGVSSAFNSGVFMTDGRLILVSNGGDILSRQPSGGVLTALKKTAAGPLYGVAVLDDDTVALAGPHGVRLQTLSASHR